MGDNKNTNKNHIRIKHLNESQKRVFANKIRDKLRYDMHSVFNKVQTIVSDSTGFKKYCANFKKIHGEGDPSDDAMKSLMKGLELVDREYHPLYIDDFSILKDSSQKITQETKASAKKIKRSSNSNAWDTVKIIRDNEGTSTRLKELPSTDLERVVHYCSKDKNIFNRILKYCKHELRTYQKEILQADPIEQRKKLSNCEFVMDLTRKSVHKDDALIYMFQLLRTIDESVCPIYLNMVPPSRNLIHYLKMLEMEARCISRRPQFLSQSSESNKSNKGKQEFTRIKQELPPLTVELPPVMEQTSFQLLMPSEIRLKHLTEANFNVLIESLSKEEHWRYVALSVDDLILEHHINVSPFEFYQYLLFCSPRDYDRTMNMLQFLKYIDATYEPVYLKRFLPIKQCKAFNAFILELYKKTHVLRNKCEENTRQEPNSLKRKRSESSFSSYLSMIFPLDSSSPDEEVGESTSSSNSSRKNDSMFCTLCVAKERNCVFMPCTHSLCCRDCQEKITKCPTCRRDIQWVQPIILS